MSDSTQDMPTEKVAQTQGERDEQVANKDALAAQPAQAAHNTAPDTRSNIILIGMPGVGKSTIGIVLAKILNYDFVDVDLVIQQRCDKTLQRLIDALGPDGFISVENEVLQDMNFENTVISTGGSAVYSHDAITHLAEIGRIVYLQLNLDELKERLSDFTERGVVMRREGALSLEDLYDERIPLYERYAEITVSVDGLSITDSARKIVEALG